MLKTLRSLIKEHKDKVLCEKIKLYRIYYKLGYRKVPYKFTRWHFIMVPKLIDAYNRGVIQQFEDSLKFKVVNKKD